MRRFQAAVLAIGLTVAGAAGASAQPAGDRNRDGEGEALRIFIVSAGVGVSANPRARANTPCDITGIVRNHCAGPNGGPSVGCEIGDGQIGAASANLFTGAARTDILQSCGVGDLAAVRAFGVTYVCRGARTSRTVGQVVRHERPVSFGPNNEPKQTPPWRIVMACR
ncbi:MAG: hypothetical protein JNL66_16030 [Alphaproteobacteria bacterium]|nr:hypothetical protein [Alphaproteobacteria bacterium]